MTTNPLPPYPGPDGRLPPLPTGEVDAAFLCKRYRISKATLYNRKAALPAVQGIRKGRRVLFTPADVHSFDAVDFYLAQGFSLEDVATAQAEFLAQHSAAPGELADANALSTSSGPLDANKLLALLTEAFRQAQPQSEPDPLRTHRLLTEAAEKGYVLTTKMLAECLGFSTSTVHGFGDEDSRHGYTFRKVAAGKWRVYREETEDEPV